MGGIFLELQEKIGVLLELIHCNHHLDYWLYTPDGKLTHSTSSDQHVLDVVFKETGCFEYLQKSIGHTPVILAAKQNVRWIGITQVQDRKPQAYHILGPFRVGSLGEAPEPDPSSAKSITDAQRWIEITNNILAELSIIPLQAYISYAVMLHKLVNGEHVKHDSIAYQAVPVSRLSPSYAQKATTPPLKDRMQVFLIERALLHALIEGDENSAAAASLLAKEKVGRVRAYTGNSVLDTQIANTTFIAICVRAAIEGGLSPSFAYPVGDRYIRMIFQSTNLEHINELRNSMYHDFISLVHSLRVNPNYSKVVQSCCDYIQLHSAEQISIDHLAARLGYSKYYLSALFKKETGCSVGDYIKYARIEQAKLLLVSTNMSVEKIWEAVGFSSRSVFGKAFHSIAGMTPGEYRDRNMKI